MVSETAHPIKGAVGDAIGEAKEAVVQTGQDVKERAKDYVLAEHLPRQQFGAVQSKIYPVYFRAMAYSIGLALLGHFLWHRNKSISSWPEMFQSFNLLPSLFMVLVNALYLEPKATKGSKTIETPNVADPAAKISRKGPLLAPAAAPIGSEEEVMKSRMVRLNERLKKLNTNSSVLNILTLMALIWHLVYLGQRLTETC
ncbi:subtilisin-like protease-like [Hibiscus syriacus]|uniref:Subtilisin-like protease-like n=1 Tax=Hibiscus syriacus TaxID=106335 RepID=A0A6A2ZQ17_HIBSY|nr:subtilisin-like protease-like [Hibiscus syriacus]